MDSTSVNRRSCSYVAPLSVLLLATVPPSDNVSTTSSDPITNAFLMESPSTSLAEPLGGIERPALVTHFEIQARTIERTGVPHRPDPLSLAHVVALLDVDVRDMGVERVVVVAVVEDDQVPIPLKPPRAPHVAAVPRGHLRPLCRLNIHSVPKRPGSEPRVHLGAEGAHQAPIGRPRQRPPQGSESTPGQLTRDARRHLGQPALLGRQLPNERFQATGGFAELADHALVVGPLIPDLHQQCPALHGLPIGFGLLPRSLRPEGGQLCLTSFLPFFAVGKPIRSYTILLNNTGVQGSQVSQAAQDDEAFDGILPGQENGEGRPLGVDLVHHPQPLGERNLLPGAVTLKPVDVPPDRRDLALQAPHLTVQTAHVALFVGQAAFRLFQFGEHRGFSPARIGRLLPLVLELALGLLQPALLGLARILFLRRLCARRTDEREEQQEQQNHAGPRRPRASHPPSPPRLVPASRRPSIAGGSRNSSRGRPMVCTISG